MSAVPPDLGEIAAAVAALVPGAGLERDAVRAEAERLARVVLDEPAGYDLRLGPYNLDTKRAAVQSAATAAVLAIAIRSEGIDSLPVAVVALVMPFLVDIERVTLSASDEVIVAAMRSHARPGGAREWYEALPAELRSQLTELEFIDFLERCELAGVITRRPRGDIALTRRAPGWFVVRRP